MTGMRSAVCPALAVMWSRSGKCCMSAWVDASVCGGSAYKVRSSSAPCISSAASQAEFCNSQKALEAAIPSLIWI